MKHIIRFEAPSVEVIAHLLYSSMYILPYMLTFTLYSDIHQAFPFSFHKCLDYTTFLSYPTTIPKPPIRPHNLP